jgi:integrase
MSADGSQQRRLTRNNLGDGSPSWSPDGSEIVFTRGDDDATDLYLMRADGSNVVASRRMERARPRPSHTPHVLRRTTGTALSEARVPEAAAAAMMGHSLEVFDRAYVKAHRDALGRDRARDALVELGLGVTPT